MYKSNKKGQVTIFIIIAVIVMAGVGLFFAFQNTSLKNLFISGSDSVSIFVEQCIEDVGAEAVYEIGKNGGYVLAPEHSTILGTPYYIQNNESYLPTKRQIQDEISTYVNKKLAFCINDFEDFPDFVISSGNINTETTIEDENVILNVDYPLTITKGSDTNIIDNFKNIKIPVRLGIVYDSIGQIVEEHVNKTNICLTCIDEILLENDLFIQLIDTDKGDIIFVVTDKKSERNDKFFDFIFSIDAESSG